MPRVAGIDVVRAANYLKDGEKSGNPYKRQVDIVLEYPDGKEEWVELKSYSTKTIASSVRPKSKVFAGANVFREFFHDYRLNDEFITTSPSDKGEIFDVTGHEAKTNQIFSWYYQYYAKPKGVNNQAEGPKAKQVDNLKKKLCNKPRDARIEDYQYNFGKTRKTVENKCRTKANDQVILRDTKSYFVEVLDIIGNDFALAVKNELAGVE